MTKEPVIDRMYKDCDEAINMRADELMARGGDHDPYTAPHFIAALEAVPPEFLEGLIRQLLMLRSVKQVDTLIKIVNYYWRARSRVRASKEFNAAMEQS